ncbi:MAG: C10 family peptidase [Treponema sp.]|nr:C10 family peptidase [Treponema sp.]
MIRKSFIALFVVFSFFGCKNIIINNERQDCSVPERLSNIDLSKTNNLTVSEMEEYLLKALQMEKENVSRAIMDENKYDLSLVQTDLIEFCTENKTERCITDNFGKVQLFLYNFSNKEKKENGYAITSTDTRIGNILAIVYDSDFSVDDGFSDFYYPLLIEYVKKIGSICQQYEQLNNNKSVYSDIATSGEYTFNSWSYHNGNLNNIINLEWNQSYPYNMIVSQKFNSNYYTGCGPTALAMLLANIEYPEQCSISEYQDVKYDWDAMKASSKAIYLPYDSQYMIGVLMYELGKKLNCSYSSDGTGCYDINISDYVHENLCNDTDFYSYNVNTIKDSIDKGYPVLCGGSSKKKVTKYKLFSKTIWTKTNYSEGHYWIIDGYATLSCTATNILNNETVNIQDLFLHCNPGWGGNKNGYYFAGVFDFNHVPAKSVSGRGTSTTTSYTRYYYQYDLGIFPYIRKDYNMTLQEDDDE